MTKVLNETKMTVKLGYFPQVEEGGHGNKLVLKVVYSSF